MKKLLCLSLIAFTFGYSDLLSANRYWISGSASNWNNTANWSTTSGGAGGASVPGSSDVANFDGNGTGNCSIDAAVNVLGWSSAAGYTGTVSQGANTITIGTTGATMSGGTFSGGSVSITISGILTISGCAFTSTSNTLTITGNYTLSSGSFTHNSGTVKFTTTNTITGATTFSALTFSPGVTTTTFTVASGTQLIVEGSLTLENTQPLSINGDTIKARGDINLTNTHTSGGGTSWILIDGTSNQAMAGGSTQGASRVGNVRINKSSGTLTLSNNITIVKDWMYTSGTLSAGTSSVYFSGSKTITGSHSLYNVLFGGTGASAYTIASGTTLTITGTMSTNGSDICAFYTGTINAQGDISIGNTYTNNPGGNASIVINGTGNQAFAGSTTAGGGRLPAITINKSSGTLTLSNTISTFKNWTYTAGTISAGSSTLYLTSTLTISGTHTLNHLTLVSGINLTLSSGTTLTLNGDLTYLSGGSGTGLYTGTLDVKGNITINNSSSNTAGTATVKITGTGSQTFTGSGTAGGGRLPHVTIEKSSGTLTLASIISVDGNWTYVSGTVSPGTSTVALYGNFNLDGQGASATMSFYRVGVQGGTRTLTGNVDANDNFVISTGATCVGGSYTINVGGNWNSQGTWTYGTSTVVFDGVNYNWIAGASGATVNFASVSVNRRSGKSVRLLNPLKVNTAMTLTLGRVKTDATNYLEFADNATCTVNNDDSAYVHGPVRKTGDDAFTFPLGDTTLHDSIAYHPLGITAPGSATDRFEAQYFPVAQTLGDSIVDSLYNLSTSEYWTLNRQVGTSNIIATLSWNRNSSNTSVYGNMRVANWNGTFWQDLGASQINVDEGRGSVTSATNPVYVTSIANLTLANEVNPHPYAVLKKKLDGGYYQAIDGRLFFRFDEEYAETGTLLFNIYNDQHELIVTTSTLPTAVQPQVVYGSNYYRLNTVSCEMNLGSTGFYILEVINDKNEKWYLRFKQDSNIIFSPCPPPSNPQ